MVHSDWDGDHINSFTSHCILLSPLYFHKTTEEFPPRPEKNPNYWADLQGVETGDVAVEEVQDNRSLYWEHSGSHHSGLPAGQGAHEQRGVVWAGSESDREISQVRQWGLQGKSGQVRSGREKQHLLLVRELSPRTDRDGWNTGASLSDIWRSLASAGLD